LPCSAGSGASAASDSPSCPGSRGSPCRSLAIAALASAALGIPLILAGTHLVPGYAARDVVLAAGFVLAVAAVVLAVLGLVLSTRTVDFIAALAVTVGWIVLGVVFVVVSGVNAR
jgi:uncharacterized membrane protein